MVALTSLVAVPCGLTIIAATFGVVVTLAIIAGGSTSGAHINPAVSLANALASRLRRDLVLAYVFFQLLGAVVAGAILRIVFPASEQSRFLGSTLLAPSTSPVVGTLIELAGTFLLSAVALLASSRVQKLSYQAILVGVTLFSLILIIGPFTSASLNPARSIGPAFASGHLENLQVYLIGPLSRGAVAGLLARWRTQREKIPLCLC